MNQIQKEYREFLKSKAMIVESSGIDFDENKINSILFDHQIAAVKWALKIGRSLIAFDTGLGKTGVQLEWCRILSEKFNKPALILTPLGVSFQMKKEAKELLNIDAKLCKNKEDVISGINITNYEKLHNFNPDDFCCIAVDESSIIKNFAGKFKKQLTEFSKNIKYKLSLSATPSPNDYSEIGNQAEFLDVMTYNEMLSCFFLNDTKLTVGKWRLKGHAKKDFFIWLSSWSLMIRKPSDLGFVDDRYNLTKLKYVEKCIDKSDDDILNNVKLAKGINQIRKANRETLGDRCQCAADIVNNSNETFMIWCNLNDESNLLKKLIPDAVEVKGSDKSEYKEKSIIDFIEGKTKVLISKAKIFGFGINAQYVCNNTVFVGLNYSMEMLLQAVKRIHRFGQKKDVNAYLVYTEREGDVLRILKEKEQNFDNMHKELKKLINIKDQFEFNLYKSDNSLYNEQIILPKFL